MGRVTVVGGKVGMEAPVTYDPVFANNSWEAVIEACQKNKVPVTWVVGDQKTMTINGKDYQIDIIGKNHDVYSDGFGTAPLTFQLHDLYTNGSMNTSETNSGGWASCNMRKTTLPNILALLPSEVQAGIKEVNKLTSAGSKQSTINTTADKLFLLSEIEVFGTATQSFSGEGAQYDYYKAGNSKKKKYNGSDCYWMERSPCKTSTTTFCNVSFSGGSAGSNNGYGTYICFAFCF